MKQDRNIHVIPTDKPSRLSKLDNSDKIKLFDAPISFRTFERSPQNIYITSDEEIKEGDWVLDLDCIGRVKKADNLIVITSTKEQCWYYKKIILTTDQDLINDGVQAIDDDFLEWFVKNPSCEEVEVKSRVFIPDGTIYDIIIPKEEPDYTALLQPIGTTRETTLEEVAKKLKGKELFKESNDRARETLSEIKSLPKQETLEEAAENYNLNTINAFGDYESFIAGAKWQKEQDKKLYSEEEVKNKCVAGCKHFYGGELKHHKDCFYYPESLSKMYDNLEWQQEQDKNKYSEEDMKKAFQAGKNNNQWSFSCPDFKEWFEQFKKK